MNLHKNNIWNIAIFTITHIASIILFFFYYNSTNINSEVKIQSNSDISITITTPLNNKEVILNQNKNYFVLNKRPIKQLDIKFEKKNYTIRKFPLNYTLKDNDKYVSINTIHPNKSIYDVLIWLITKKNIIYFYIFFNIFLFFLPSFLNFKSNIIKLKQSISKQYFLIINDSQNSSINEQQIEVKLYQKILSVIIFITICGYLLINNDNNPLRHTSLESKRALVALEMKLSNNYVIPTINGEPYLNKLPAGHWIYAAFLNKNHNNNESILRKISASFLILSSLLIFMFLYKEKKSFILAILTSIGFLGSAYVLNFKVLKLDHQFVFICLLLFFSNYLFTKRNKYLLLFLTNYTFTFLGFMIKGFVMYYFGFISITAILLIFNKQKKILSYNHLIGISLLLSLTLIYLIVYSMYNNPFDYVYNQIFQLNHLTHYDNWHYLKHFLGFWGYNMIQYSPIMILFPIVFFHKNILFIVKDKMMFYFMILSLSCMAIFWISPEFQTYYTLMFIPLIIYTIFYLILSTNDLSNKNKITLLIVILLLSLFSTLMPTKESLEYLYVAIPFVLISVIPILTPIKYRINTYLILFVLIVFFSIKLDTNNYKYQNARFLEEKSKQKAKEISDKYINEKMMIFSKETKVQDAVSFYLELNSNKIIRFADNSVLNSNTLLLANKSQITDIYTVMDSIPQQIYMYENINRHIYTKYEPLYLIKKK